MTEHKATVISHPPSQLGNPIPHTFLIGEQFLIDHQVSWMEEQAASKEEEHSTALRSVKEALSAQLESLTGDAAELAQAL